MFYRVLGLMSGTSLDGLDVAYCEFNYKQGKWTYDIKKATTYAYDEDFKQKIRSMEETSAREFARFSVELGHFFGKKAKAFLDTHSLDVDFVASHGQTIFHRPDLNYTTQIGDLSALCSEVQVKVIGDFRSMDVALGGQGAPLVPIGDEILFCDYENCLNLGGFSNISMKKQGKRIAYDICPVNIVLNHLCEKLSLPFDDGGQIAASGKVDENLLKQLNDLPYYKKKTNKSLGKEWVVENVFPLLEKTTLSVEDLLATYTEHIAEQLSRNISGKTLLTGGGAYNTYLIERVKKLTPHTIELPEKTIIDYKEAMIFAFLGVLRQRGEVNCLASVTGAEKDNCGGSIVQWN
jgi:anhydro-N-acetylmuramic acid kinase